MGYILYDRRNLHLDKLGALQISMDIILWIINKCHWQFH